MATNPNNAGVKITTIMNIPRYATDSPLSRISITYASDVGMAATATGLTPRPTA